MQCPAINNGTLIRIYRVSGDFMSTLQNLIPEIIPRQKCRMNIGPVLTGYGTMDGN
jgi:hypothetical protein